MVKSEKTKLIILTVVLTFVTLSICLLFSINSYKLNFQSIHYEKIDDKEELINILSNTISIQSDYSGYYKFQENFSVKDIEGNELLLEDIINKPTIILYIDRHHCQSCFVETIKELEKRIKKEIRDIPSAIFAGNFELRELKAFLKSGKINIQCFIVDNSQSDFLNKMNESGHSFFIRKYIS